MKDPDSFDLGPFLHVKRNVHLAIAKNCFLSVQVGSWVVFVIKPRRTFSWQIRLFSPGQRFAFRTVVK